MSKTPPSTPKKTNSVVIINILLEYSTQYDGQATTTTFSTFVYEYYRVLNTINDIVNSPSRSDIKAASISKPGESLVDLHFIVIIHIYTVLKLYWLE